MIEQNRWIRRCAFFLTYVCQDVTKWFNWLVQFILFICSNAQDKASRRELSFPFCCFVEQPANICSCLKSIKLVWIKHVCNYYTSAVQPIALPSWWSLDCVILHIGAFARGLSATNVLPRPHWTSSALWETIRNVCDSYGCLSCVCSFLQLFSLRCVFIIFLVSILLVI